MIQLIKKSASPIPVVLQTIGKTATQELKQKFKSNDSNFDFVSSIYGHSEVKEKLIELQNYKCCFCESKIGHLSYGDVEHYRPKAGWVQNEEPINKPGYFWLAYDWDNLLLSCQKCNQRFKKNYFPLLNETQRASPEKQDISIEEPFFINPVYDNPANFISFREEIPYGIDAENRGDKTIEKLGLDRELLNEQRRQTLNMIKDIYYLAKGIPETSPELKKQANKIIQKYYDQSRLDSTEYSSMLQNFFLTNPILNDPA